MHTFQQLCQGDYMGFLIKLDAIMAYLNSFYCNYVSKWLAWFIKTYFFLLIFAR